jgi:hypothetical protein
MIRAAHHGPASRLLPGPLAGGLRRPPTWSFVLVAVLAAVLLGALVMTGAGLWSGALTGRAPFGLTVIPALFGGTVIAAALVSPWCHLMPPPASGTAGGPGRAWRAASEG